MLLAKLAMFFEFYFFFDFFLVAFSPIGHSFTLRAFEFYYVFSCHKDNSKSANGSNLRNNTFVNSHIRNFRIDILIT